MTPTYGHIFIGILCAFTVIACVMFGGHWIAEFCRQHRIDRTCLIIPFGVFFLIAAMFFGAALEPSTKEETDREIAAIKK